MTQCTEGSQWILESKGNPNPAITWVTAGAHSDPGSIRRRAVSIVFRTLNKFTETGNTERRFNFSLNLTDAIELRAELDRAIKIRQDAINRDVSGLIEDRVGGKRVYDEDMPVPIR